MAAPRRRARGHIEELPFGRYRAVVYTGIDPLTGQRHYAKESAENYDAARVALTKLQRRRTPELDRAPP